MTTTVRAVFWDMDGTLIDTEALHYRVIRDWCARHGFTLTEKDNHGLFGKTMGEKFRLLSPKLTKSSTEEIFRRECQEDYILSLKPEMGLERALKIARALGEKGIPQACVSNGERAVVQANLAILGLADTFAFFVSGEDVEQGKPDPAPYLKAAERAGVDPSVCLAVEDSNVGMISAKAAGCILCAWPNDPSMETNADYVLDTGDEFPFYLID